MLRQTPGVSHSATNSFVCPPAKKKSYRSTYSESSGPTIFIFFSFTFFRNFIFFRDQLDSSMDSSSTETEQETRVELMIPHIICEEEGDEDMVANLRVGFKERQHKCLFESITVVFLPTKKPCTEILCPVPVLAIAPMLKPSVAVVGPNHVLDEMPYVEKDALLELGGPSTSPIQLSDDSVECVAFVPPFLQAPRAPRWEEMIKLMK